MSEEGGTNTSTMSPAEEVFVNKSMSMRAVVGASCCLSVLGSLLIIFSYILFKKRRTRAREILLHISLMDLGVALANLIGLSVYFDKFYFEYHENVPDYIESLCKTQAFFAAYCTLSSILWTIALAGFLYFLIMHHTTRRAIYFLWCSYVVCYALPLFVCLWLVTTEKLGHSPLDSSGWCTLISKDIATGKVDFFSTIFGYDLWIYLAIVTIPLFYLSIKCYLATQVNAVKDYITPDKFWSSLHHVDYKFLIIPVVFVFLRIWSAILSILYDYIQLDVSQVPTSLNLVLLYLSGIGDSSQGFANAILFIIFTKNIRESFIEWLRCRKGQDNEDLENGGQMRTPSISPTSHLNHFSGGIQGEKKTTAESDSEVTELEEEEVPLVFGNLLSSQNHKPGEQSNHFQHYGAIS